MNSIVWSDNLYIVLALVVAGAALGLFLLNWVFDRLLD